MIGFSRLIRVNRVRIMIRVSVGSGFRVNIISVRVITVLMAPSIRHVSQIWYNEF